MLVIHKDSHLDHGLTAEHKVYILNRFKYKSGFFIETFELPDYLEPLFCGLYGPAMGDGPIPEEKVVYAPRNGREYKSRLVALPSRPTRVMTVIAGPHEGQPCVLYTSYGGPSTPREPGDPTLPEKDREASVKFWSEHALCGG